MKTIWGLYLTLIRMVIITKAKRKTISEDLEKEQHYFIAHWTVNGTTIMKNNM